jgi:hypothetical protein
MKKNWPLIIAGVAITGACLAFSLMSKKSDCCALPAEASAQKESCTSKCTAGQNTAAANISIDGALPAHCDMSKCTPEQLEACKVKCSAEDQKKCSVAQ